MFRYADHQPVEREGGGEDVGGLAGYDMFQLLLDGRVTVIIGRALAADRQMSK